MALRILIVGGSRFVGRHITEAALGRGHSVTHFNRGLSAPEALPGVEEIRGDRTVDLGLLAGRTWDVVVDTPGYQPSAVAASANALSSAVGTYCFISTLSVYAGFRERGMDESAALATPPPGDAPVTDKTYGPLKVGCENAVRAVFGQRALVIRPGYIVGPYDPTDRFTYWLARTREAGEIFVPGTPRDLLQLIDARDLAAWVVALLEDSVHGAFNATGPAAPLTWGEMLATADAVAGNGARFTWADEAFVIESGLADTPELPIWSPSAFEGLHAVDIRRALANGLRLRPLAETIADTLAWYASRASEPLRAGLDAPREQDLLARFRAWKRSRIEG